ncbi:hypothetical protein EZH22_16000 [Xanthobacter dioxanivorans]|uniref:Uncharacterized protein n=1 Tax=Xanthobacter dioxanivorans TaxID=2528964 RepID=A0A974SGT5_9HYPH|nr:hypothetical protein [Xanthobacter dioxanivorans]QRG04672.1 hypothetical protein EZH22_16000 [Xanthobacter dioxanivorans]
MRQDLGVSRRFGRARHPLAIAGLLATLLLCATGAIAPARAAADAATVKIQGPAVVRMFGANCLSAGCWLSGLFAPIVVRENTAVVTLANGGSTAVTLTARFTPTNGLAVALGDTTPFGALKTMTIAPGEIRALPLSLPNGGLQAGLYTGELGFAGADGKVLSVPVEVRIRSSAVWALFTALCGIVLGRLAQLTYDPRTVARLQLLDRLNELEPGLASLPGGDQARLKPLFDSLRRRLAERSADAATLQPEVEALEAQIEAARRAPPPATAQLDAGAEQVQPAGPAPGFRSPGIGRRVLLWLAGISPVPLQFTYDWLLPVFTLLTLAALTIVFVLQQYGGSGTAETFGAGGLADYAGLFLAGIASEAIAGGLRKVKLG